MSEAEIPGTGRAGSARRWLRRAGLGVLVAVGLLAGLAGVALWRLDGRAVAVPGPLRGAIERRINASLAPFAVSVPRMSVVLAPREGPPRISLREVAFRDEAGRTLGVLGDMTATFDRAALWQGRLLPVRVTIRGATLALTRFEDGTFSIRFGSAQADEDFDIAGAALDVFGAIAAAFSPEALSRLERIESQGTRIRIADEITGRTLQFADGRVIIERGGGQLRGTVGFALDLEGADERRDPADVLFSWTQAEDARGVRIELRAANLYPGMLAGPLALPAWLSVIEAPVDAAAALELAPDGSVGDLQGVIELGAGRIGLPLLAGADGVEHAKAYLSYDPARRRLRIDQFALRGQAVRLDGQGVAYLSFEDGRLAATVAQLRLDGLDVVGPDGTFAAPVRFDGAAIDLRLATAPFRLDIGQLALWQGADRVTARGGIGSSAGGIDYRLDLAAPGLDVAHVLAMWPIGVVPKTRKWLVENVSGGRLEQLTASLRGTIGAPPRAAVSFGFRDARVRYIRQMPPVEEGRGTGQIAEGALTISLDEGHVVAPTGQRIDLAGSRFRIPDITVKPAPSVVELTARARLKALLALFDLPPFEFLTKGGVARDVADANVAAQARIAFPLKPKVTLADVDLQAEGTLRDVRSDRLVAGKVVTAEQMRATIDNTAMVVSGPGRVGAVRFEGMWVQRFGPEHRGRSRFEAQLRLTDAALREFGVNLPKGAVQGEGVGVIAIALRRGEPPAFTLRSDVNRLILAIPQIGWRKPANARGSLEVAGRFGRPVEIDTLRLEAAGLSVAGDVVLHENNTLDVVRLARVRVADWFEGSVNLRAVRDGVALEIASGSLDFRRATLAGGGGGEGGNLPIIARLDRFQITEAIALTGLSANLATAGGVTGTFTGRVNGGPPIEGTIAPAPGGVRVRATATDAGAVLRAAGLFDDARGGSFTIGLVPGGAPRSYLGEVAIRDIRVRRLPALAELINAISVVGLLEQLDGEGLRFAEAEARFRINPGEVVVEKASATAPGLALTAEGRYDLSRGVADLHGVITPFFMVNGALERTGLFGGLFGRRKGEGVVGVNYTMRGPLDAPRVSVNPFSVFTPGVFREIFRQPPRASVGQ